MATSPIWRKATQPKCPSPDDITRAFRTLSPSDAPHQSKFCPLCPVHIFTLGCWFLMFPCQALIPLTAPVFCPSQPLPGWHPWCGAYLGTRKKPDSNSLLMMELKAHLKGRLFCLFSGVCFVKIRPSITSTNCSAGFADSGMKKWQKWAWRKLPWFELSFASKEPGWFSPLLLAR